MHPPCLGLVLGFGILALLIDCVPRDILAHSINHNDLLLECFTNLGGKYSFLINLVAPGDHWLQCDGHVGGRSDGPDTSK